MLKNKEIMLDNLPNRLTIFRMVMVPIVIICLFLCHDTFKSWHSYQNFFGWTAGWIFALASITDYFDGYIARKRNIVTIFGSFLDPIADKFLVVSSLLMLQSLGRLPVIIVIILVLREIYITSLRLLALSENIESPPVTISAKWKTGTQMVGIPLIMAQGTPWGIPMAPIGTILLYASSCLSLYSAFTYSINTVKHLKESKQNKEEEKENEKNQKDSPEDKSSSPDHSDTTKE